jgi:hypothetical protein
MIGGRISGGWSNDGRAGFGAYNRWWASLHPSVTYFVRDRVGLGVWAGGGSGSATRQRINEASIGVQALLDVPLGARVSLFVQPFVGFLYESTTLYRQAVVPRDVGFVLDDVRINRQYMRVGTDLPLVFHFSESVAIGLGPALTADFFVKDDVSVDAASGASGNTYTSTSSHGWRVITGISSFIGASF